VTADLKTIAAHGMYGLACITANTVQNTQRVDSVRPASAELVHETLAALMADFDVAAVKIGMLGTREIVETVAEVVEAHRFCNVVVDPVLMASAGAELLQPDAIEPLCNRLLPLTTALTPNRSEAQRLTGESELEKQGRRLLEFGAHYAVITGGGEQHAPDVLFTANTPPQEFRGEHIDSTSTHGTGCAFSTALACRLAQGRQIADAIAEAKEFVAGAIRNARPLGKGHGPIDHFWRTRD